jgi:hypothetical protein
MKVFSQFLRVHVIFQIITSKIYSKQIGKVKTQTRNTREIIEYQTKTETNHRQRRLPNIFK